MVFTRENRGGSAQHRRRRRRRWWSLLVVTEGDPLNMHRNTDPFKPRTDESLAL